MSWLAEDLPGATATPASRGHNHLKKIKNIRRDALARQMHAA
jgi:hypothetical protein